MTQRQVIIDTEKCIRSFKETEISKNIIEQILEAGRLTHTAKNMQDNCYISKG